MIDLLEISEIDFNKANLVALFDGLFEEGFIVDTDFEYDKVQEEFRDDDLGLNDYFLPENISFWYLKITKANGEEVSFSDRITNTIKHEIEDKLYDLLLTEINE